MTDCCQPAYAGLFNSRRARKDAKSYRKKGLDGQSAQECRIDQAVHSGVGADPQRQREHGDRNENGALAQQTDREPHILPGTRHFGGLLA